VKYVLFYESAEDVAERAPRSSRGTDPFVVNDVVRSWEVREWDEAVDP
jgi:hypothetical protein